MSLKVLFFLTAFNFVSALNFTCPSGSVKSTTSNVCYTFSTTPTTFIQAQVNCTEQGGNLVDVDSQITNMLLIANAETHNWENFWIGATLTKVYNDAGIVKIWIWEGLDKIVKYDDWAFNEPSNKGGCAAVKTADGTWFADDCSSKRNYVCSIPMQIDVCEPEWMYFAPTRSCYKVLYHSDWNSAENNCVLSGGHLVSIHSDIENSFVQDIAQYGFKVDDWATKTYIGLYTKTNDNSIWKWTDGSPVDYPTPWFTNEPDAPGLQKCVLMVTDPAYAILAGYWGNTQCDVQMRNYVCKSQPKQISIQRQHSN